MQAALPERDYPWFASGVASWFGAWGMQSVIFSWLVVGELRAEAEWVGVAQTSTMLPALALLLVGGAAADRRDPRRMLIGLHLVAAIPALVLAAALAWGFLSFGLLIVYGLAIGTVQAFVLPARDALLSRVAGSDMMRAVTGMTAAQFGAQATGTLVGGAARWLGSPTMLVIESLIFALGSTATKQISEAPARAEPASSSMSAALREIREGIDEAARNARLRSPLLLVLAVGFLFIGPFMVLFPLLVRDFYEGGVGRLSLVLALFPVGTITGSLVLRRFGLRRKGLAALLALVGGAAALAVVGQGVPFPVLVGATFAWGLCGSVFINCCRTIYQEAAPPEHRARVLSIYQLGFMGAAPLGTLCAGFVSGLVGPLVTLHLCSAAMIVVVVLVWSGTQVSTME
jgi:MFS family permease